MTMTPELAPFSEEDHEIKCPAKLVTGTELRHSFSYNKGSETGEHYVCAMFRKISVSPSDSV